LLFGERALTLDFGFEDFESDALFLSASEVLELSEDPVGNVVLVFA